jgi:hypothetical protein
MTKQTVTLINEIQVNTYPTESFCSASPDKTFSNGPSCRSLMPFVLTIFQYIPDLEIIDFSKETCICRLNMELYAL